MVDVSTVIRNWWSFPAVGFNSILEIPVEKFEVLPGEEPPPVGTVVVPNSIFGLPLRKDLLYRAYWWYRRKLAGFDKTMMLYKWEWPGSNKKVRSQKKSGKSRMGRRKAPSKFQGSHCHALRPKDWGTVKFQAKVRWLSLRVMLSVKFAQGQIKVVDSMNLQSHKTKHLVQNLRRLVGRRCHSAMLVHEGFLDVNDNCRWASAHIPAVRRENVEGVNVYNLLRYHQVIFTEAALTKLIREIQTYPKKKRWGQIFATPDGKPAPVPEKVPGWNKEWIEKKERLKNAEFRLREFYHEQQKWKWSTEIKGPMRVPRYDPVAGFRVKDYVLEPERPVWEKLESLYVDDEPLEGDVDDEEYAEIIDTLESNFRDGEIKKAALIEDKSEVVALGLKQLALKGRGGRVLVAGKPAAAPAGEGEKGDSA